MELYRQTVRLIDEERSFAFAVVVRASGSTPQKAGAKALFERAGEIHGTLGGGCLEAEARRRALDALDSGKPMAFDLSLNDDYGWDDGLICGGSVRVLIDGGAAPRCVCCGGGRLLSARHNPPASTCGRTRRGALDRGIRNRIIVRIR